MRKLTIALTLALLTPVLAHAQNNCQARNPWQDMWATPGLSMSPTVGAWADYPAVSGNVRVQSFWAYPVTKVGAAGELYAETPSGWKPYQGQIHFYEYDYNPNTGAWQTSMHFKQDARGEVSETPNYDLTNHSQWWPAIYNYGTEAINVRMVLKTTACGTSPIGRPELDEQGNIVWGTRGVSVE